MIPLGQFRDTFIIAVDDEGIAIIDQHVAHERVLFERVMERLTSGRLESQRLLVPLVLEMPPAAHQALSAARRSSSAWGSRSRLSATTTIKVAAVPALLDAGTARRRCWRWPRTSKGSTAARTSRTRCSGSPRPRRVTRR